MPEFVRVAQLSDVPHDEMTVIELDGHLVLLVWIEGQLYAVEDDCTHVGGPLDEGDVEGTVLTCPWHLAQFDMRTGHVLRGPAREDLRTYAVRLEGEDVLIERPSEIAAQGSET